MSPAAAARAIIRWRNERGSSAQGVWSSSIMLTTIWPLRGAYGRMTNVDGSGMSRISPTGP